MRLEFQHTRIYVVTFLKLFLKTNYHQFYFNARFGAVKILLLPILKCGHSNLVLFNYTFHYNLLKFH